MAITNLYRSTPRSSSESNSPSREQSTLNERAALEHWIASQVGVELMKHYPRLKWEIIVDVQQQMVVIVCPFISTEKGYHLKLMKYTIHELQKKAVMVAGEMLERHGLSRRQTIDLGTVEEAKRNLRGSIVGPDSAPEAIH